MKFAITILLGLVVVFGSVRAESSIALANQLGTILAAEKFCHFSYDMTAIQNFIAKNVPESDMSFGTMLQTMVEGQTIEMRDMTPATLMALCTQTGRVAKYNGFIH